MTPLYNKSLNFLQIQLGAQEIHYILLFHGGGGCLLKIMFIIFYQQYLSLKT